MNSNLKWPVAVTAAVGTFMLGAVARATEPSPDEAPVAESIRPRDLPAAVHSVELTISTGYAQGVGGVGSGLRSLAQTQGAGGDLQLSAGYRVLPRLTLGIYGSGGIFARGDRVDGSAPIYSATAGTSADFHLWPYAHEWDPWLSVGTGWRGYWIDENGGATSLHGWEMGRLQIGVDRRITPEVSISPVVGADLTMFFSQATAQTSGFRNVSRPNVDGFLFAGLMGRFDLPVTPTAKSVASR